MKKTKTAREHASRDYLIAFDAVKCAGSAAKLDDESHMREAYLV